MRSEPGWLIAFIDQAAMASSSCSSRNSAAFLAWLDAVPAWPYNAAMAKHHDIIIVGAGAVGLAAAIGFAQAGCNVAVIFGDGLPETWNGYAVIDGDLHDLRHLDPRGGVVVGLAPKGNKAKKSDSPFIVRGYAIREAA